MSSRFLALFLLLSACHTTSSWTSPPTSGERSLILLVEKDGVWSVIAIDLQKSADQFPQLAYKSSMKLFALTQRCDLKTLGLSSGQLGLRETPRDRSPLPPPAKVFHTTVQDGLIQTWSEEPLDEAAQDLLHRIDLSQDQLCEIYSTPFSISPIGIPTTDYGLPTFAVAVDDESLLIGTRKGHFYRVYVDGRREEVTLPPNTPCLAGFSRPNDRIWLCGYGGACVWGTLDNGFLPLAGVPTTTTGAMQLTGMRSGAVELYLAGQTLQRSTLSRFNGAWELLHSSGPGTACWVSVNDFLVPLSLTMHGPDLFASSMGAEENQTIRHSPSQGITTQIAAIGDDGITTIGPSWSGLAAGTCQGRILLLEGDEWIWDGRAHESGYLVSAIERFGFGLVYSAHRGITADVAQYHPVAGHCGKLEVTEPVSHIVRVGPRHLFLVHANLAYELGILPQPPTSIPVTLLEETELPPSCLASNP